MKGIILSLTVVVITVGCGSSNQDRSYGQQGIKSDLCATCHGNQASNAAPPTDTLGNTDTTFRGVGAHQAHLVELRLTTALTCSDCHIQPKQPSDAGHMDTALPAEVTFGDLAKKRGAVPFWNGERCGNTYCHGATLKGGSNREPIWTKVDGSQAACGTCHGLPPTVDHPQPTQSGCLPCHDKVVDASGNIADKTLHINGVVDVIDPGKVACHTCHGAPPDYPHPYIGQATCAACHSSQIHMNGKVEVDNLDLLACNSCHGNSVNDAPPADLLGRSATTYPSIGAHQQHLIDGSISTAFQCGDCHQVPVRWSDVGHADSDLPAEVNFSSFVKLNERTPVWQGVRCNNTYCHASNPYDQNARNNSPIWTQVDGSQKQCDSCHGYPPSHRRYNYSHSSNTSCHQCHSAVVGPDHVTIINTQRHVDGRVDRY